MAVVGCDNDPADGDTWGSVTDLNQLDGTWKGSMSYTDTEYGITTKNEMEMTVIIDVSEGTVTMTQIMTTTFSGSGIDEFWEDFKAEVTIYFPGVVFDDEKYSATMTVTEVDSIDESDLDYVQINQNGTKIKVIEGGEVIILTKQ